MRIWRALGCLGLTACLSAPSDGDESATDAGATGEPSVQIADLFGDTVLYEGLGYRLATMDPLTAAAEHRPVPVVLAGLSAGDEVTITMPAGFSLPFSVCGQPVSGGDTVALSDLPMPCGVQGERGAFTIAVPVATDLSAADTLDPMVVTIARNGTDLERTIDIRLLDEAILPEQAVPAPDHEGLFSVIWVSEAWQPANIVDWRATSHIEIGAVVNVAGQAAPPCSNNMCAGGAGGPGAAGDGAGYLGEDTESCDMLQCSAAGESGGTGGRFCSVGSCTFMKGAGGGGGGHTSEGAPGTAGGTSCQQIGVGGAPRPYDPYLVAIEEAGGGGGGAGGPVRDASTEPEPAAPGGGGGGGGGVIALESLGTVAFADQAAIDAGGGSGRRGTFSGCNAARVGGDGGGGAGGAIRLMAERLIMANPLEEHLVASGGAVDGGNGGIGSDGRIRVDGIGSDGLSENAARRRGPTFLDPLPAAIVSEPAPVIAVDGGTGADTVELGLRRAGEPAYQPLPAAASMTSVALTGELAAGLNELCLFAERPTDYSVAAIAAPLKRCIWLAYLPDD